MCSWGLVSIYPVDSIQFKILYFILVVLEFILPIVPITTSCVISVTALRPSSPPSAMITLIDVTLRLT